MRIYHLVGVSIMLAATLTAHASKGAVAIPVDGNAARQMLLTNAETYAKCIGEQMKKQLTEWDATNFATIEQIQKSYDLVEAIARDKCGYRK